MWNGQSFHGSKVALYCGDQLVTYLRDEKAGIPFPGQWDLPGGGREGDEDPISCGLREIEEEFGLALDRRAVTYVQNYPGMGATNLDSYFFAVEVTPEQLSQIRFGDEGQRWQLMSFTAYLDHPKAVPHLTYRLRGFLASGLTRSLSI